MPIIARKPRSDYALCPEGLHHAVCVDVIDLGLVKTQFGEKEKVQLVWQIEDVDVGTGQRYQVQKRYTLSLHEKASLTKDLEGWRGRKFTKDELDGFDVENVLGKACQVQVEHELKENGSIFANVKAVVSAPKGVPPLKPLNYMRKAAQQAGNSHDLDAVPF